MSSKSEHSEGTRACRQQSVGNIYGVQGPTWQALEKWRTQVNKFFRLSFYSHRSITVTPQQIGLSTLPSPQPIEQTRQSKNKPTHRPDSETKHLHKPTITTNHKHIPHHHQSQRTALPITHTNTPRVCDQNPA